MHLCTTTAEADPVAECDEDQGGAVTHSLTEHLTTPRPDDLGLIRIANKTGLSVRLLPNGAIFALEHRQGAHQVMINQSLGSPIAGGMGRLCLRTGGTRPMILPVAGAEVRCRVGAADNRFAWEGQTLGVRHHASLRLHPNRNLWFWRVEIINERDDTLSCDTILIQDLGLGEQNFLMNNEAYASQYLDHHIARHPRMGYILMGRQNLPQDGKHPWVVHGCLEGAVEFATDFRQLMGPAHRDADGFGIGFGTDLPSKRLQHETACAALQSTIAKLESGATTSWTFFGAYQPDHPAASSDVDLVLTDDIEEAAKDPAIRPVNLNSPPRSILLEASSAVTDFFDEKAIQERYPRQMHVERVDGQPVSLFVPGDTHHRHIILRDKDLIVLRRHGALLRSGEEMLPNESTLCVTCWMHGVFGAQLTIGNTSFHQLFSVSRDPYNIVRGSGLRMLMDAGDGWRLLTVPSVFEIGLSDCRWVYRFGARTITVSTVVSGDEPAVQWRVAVEGEPCRFLVFGHLALSEHEYTRAAQLEIDPTRHKFSFRPDPDDMWRQHYPQAVYHLVTSTPEGIEAIGGDELLYVDGKRRGGGYAVIRTCPTNEFVFAVVGSMNDPTRAASLAKKYAGAIDDATILAHSLRFWHNVARGLRVSGSDADAGAQAVNTILPWLVHDATVHLTVPHGLEQYTGAAWGTRDVCQGPLELLLSLEHDEQAKSVLRIVFAQQYEERGDWPQWFMLEPYSAVQDKQAHGDVIVWPLKALCDYVEATGDFALLEEPIAWRREDNLEKTAAADPIIAHLDKLIATVRQRFIAGTHLIRYGNGDWNDSLQPVDPTTRDWMVSSWTVALLYEQLRRYAEILRRIGRSDAAREQESTAAAMCADFNRFLIRDGTVAGYGVFRPEGGLPGLLLHPSDQRTGLSYSLLPMTQATIGGLFTPEQARHHLGLIREHLLFSDGARLMDRPIDYHGGLETIFERAESAAFFGREIGLMYVHSHLRYAEAMATLGEAEALWNALIVVNPIAVTDRLRHASLRQRNAYFSSSDAAFRDRYQASAEWERVKAKTIAVDGGWRIYSSGSGLYMNMLIRHAFGVRRHFGKRIVKPCLPALLQFLSLEWEDKLASGLQRL
jgi:1,2-beta-oligoglucan phosphorylase